jgi:hypothetical protein
LGSRKILNTDRETVRPNDSISSGVGDPGSVDISDSDGKNADTSDWQAAGPATLVFARNSFAAFFNNL